MRHDRCSFQTLCERARRAILGSKIPSPNSLRQKTFRQPAWSPRVSYLDQLGLPTGLGFAPPRLARDLYLNTGAVVKAVHRQMLGRRYASGSVIPERWPQKFQSAVHLPDSTVRSVKSVPPKPPPGGRFLALKCPSRRVTISYAGWSALTRRPPRRRSGIARLDPPPAL
jgi:hypothetical protein